MAWYSSALFIFLEDVLVVMVSSKNCHGVKNCLTFMVSGDSIIAVDPEYIVRNKKTNIESI